MASEKLFVVAHEDASTIELLALSFREQSLRLSEIGIDGCNVLVLENACESRCFFCANPGTTAVPKERFTPWHAIERRLGERPSAAETLLIGGNDPVLHPDFDRTVEEAARVGYRRIEVMTSGLSLTPERLDRWRDSGVVGIAVPMYGASAEAHDRISGTRCFDRLVAGVRLAHAARIRVDVHTLAMRQTLGELAALARWVEVELGTRLALAPLREKPDIFRYDDEAVPLGELDRMLGELGEDVTLSLVGFPSCIAPARPRGGSHVIEVYFRTQRRDFAAGCAPCRMRNTCPGVVKAELERRGGQGLSPFV